MMLVEVKLHDIGEGMTEGEVLTYFVKKGDRVKSDQPLVEVQTDKMTAELPSPISGIVRDILIEEGTNVTVGTTLLIIDTEEIHSDSSHRPEKPLPKKRIIAAPHTRRIARELGVDIEQVVGSGPIGRVTDEDIYKFVSKAENPAPPLVEEIEEAPKQMKISPINPVEIPFKGRRKQIAAKMTKSLYTIPHVTHFEEVDVTNLLSLKNELKDDGTNISVAAFFIKAIYLALKDYPIFNSILDEEKEIIQLKQEYNIGVAVDTKEGLIVPVIHHVEQKSLKTIHQEMKEYIQKAQDNKLTREDITGGTFTISNVGPLGGIGATPIINYPESALVAFHKTKKRPAVINDEIVIRSIMNISMSFDHRVADGATAVAFTNRLVSLLENPSKMLLELK
ncbi:dihydrolipoyllysine acetyltransferase [Heyndrickxia shackletonii]|uniref:Dihydrolipoamide acetyltransferase component of pyruvate dehydrogenase complex n=1 Tax=Heyndrickxia shackletonii TaxID=157838 RepID=A0A0Q3X073_9BACI|nr:dihydrolipoamide acetyltransferase family protein [Heyndrickxia shackletonii]KQL55163.1 dihydrolipoyllysine acetyltransferase [Heyndrickxia shackletonii]NEY98681.1 2-oxo acid dehydrogenase subunit E2 [Heyndrickxia shackletonii]